MRLSTNNYLHYHIYVSRKNISLFRHRNYFSVSMKNRRINLLRSQNKITSQNLARKLARNSRITEDISKARLTDVALVSKYFSGSRAPYGIFGLFTKTGVLSILSCTCKYHAWYRTFEVIILYTTTVSIDTCYTPSSLNYEIFKLLKDANLEQTYK